MKRISLFGVAILCVLSALVGCSGSSGGASGGVTSTNAFTAAGSPITVDDMVASRSFSLLTSRTYYGRVLYISGSNLYAASIHFTLNKNSNSTAYFSDFYVDRIVEIIDESTNNVVLNSSTSLAVTGAYNAVTNNISIADATSRFVSFDVDFGDNTHFGDINNAGVIFSKDFSTMVGGDDATFFFIAQKANSQPSVGMSDLRDDYRLANFVVDNAGAINVTSTGTVTVNGTGGNGLEAFSGQSANIPYEGEVALNDASTGMFVFGFDSTYGNGTPTADQIDGVFLMSPDKQYVLGYNITNMRYFGASK